MADQPRTQVVTPRAVGRRFSWIRLLTKISLGIFTAPYRRTFKLYTWKPLKEFRKSDGDRKVFLSMVRDWKIDKYAELQSVQVAASFCAGATLATLSWSKIPNPIWVSDALFFSALICSIWAVITSIQTKSILDDLPDKDQLNSSLPETEIKRVRRVILRYKKTPGLNHWIMLFIWQFPSMTMSYAWCTFLSGLTIYVCTPFIRGDKWNDNSKVAIVYLTVGSIGLCTFLFASLFVYAGEKDYERSATSTRVSTSDMESAIGNQLAESPGSKSGQPSTGILEEERDPIQSARAKGLGGAHRMDDLDERRGSERSKRVLLF